MNPPFDADLEAERYELSAGPVRRFALARRGFLKSVGGGIVVVCALSTATARKEPGAGRRDGFQDRVPDDVDAWLHVAADGSVTVYTGKVEVGQDIRTSLAQAVAEELRAPIDSIRLVMGDTDLTPYDMGTFGSRTTPTMAPLLRAAAAAARDALLDIAAGRWSVDRGVLVAENGRVVDPTMKRSAAFGELSKGQKLLRAVAADSRLTAAAKWTIAGTSVPKVAGRDVVTGVHRYTADLTRPGMLHGAVLRPAAFGATLASIDLDAARRMDGVTVVRDGDFVGVAAKDRRAAARAIQAIRAEWTTTPQTSSATLWERLRTSASGGAAVGARGDVAIGSVRDALASAATKRSATYTVAYIAHVPLEPRAAVAEWSAGKLTVWTGTQRPFGVRSELADAFHLPETSVRVLVPDTGSGYGGKHTGDAALEAARLAKAAGAPVKVVWTREEELTWAYFRPAGVIDVTAALDTNGRLVAWEFHNYNSGGAGIRTPYAVPNQTVAFHPSESPLRQGSYRGLAATANHFARESHMDELARAAGSDPLAFRIAHLEDDRLRAVLQASAKAFGWGTSRPPKGGGVGIAAGTEKGGYVASCAEVAVDPASRAVRVTRVVTAFECGAIVNPAGLRNQIEGAVVQGLGGALFEAIAFAGGRIQNAHLSEYRVPRFRDLPVLETVLLDRKDLPSAGAGETPLVAVAPAIANAIFDATGVRLRALPLVPDGVVRTESATR